MRKFNSFSLKVLIVALCAISVFSVSVLTPEVEAASETPITETKKTETNTYTNEDDAIALARAIAMDEAKLEAENIVEELKVEEVEETVATEATEQTVYIEPTSAPASSTSSSTTTQSVGSSYVSGSTSTGYLMDIPNPDPNYTSYAIHLSDSDRELAERIVMGEAGSMGYTGMAIVAQCLRDAFVMGGHSDIASVISQYGYYGSTSITPSQTCKDVVNYIFDQGGAAVQHRTLVFYSTAYCTSTWHESQDFVCQYGSVRFFDF